jgi:hypothetical protein
MEKPMAGNPAFRDSVQRLCQKESLIYAYLFEYNVLSLARQVGGRSGSRQAAILFINGPFLSNISDPNVTKDLPKKARAA